jgi:hypothetical protein
MVTSVHVVCVLGNIRGQFINILVRYGHQDWVGQCGITIMPVAFSSEIFCNTWLIMQKVGIHKSTCLPKRYDRHLWLEPQGQV